MGRASLVQDLWLGFEARLRGRRLDEHVAFVIAALVPIADELGL